MRLVTVILRRMQSTQSDSMQHPHPHAVAVINAISDAVAGFIGAAFLAFLAYTVYVVVFVSSMV